MKPAKALFILSAIFLLTMMAPLCADPSAEAPSHSAAGKESVAGAESAHAEGGMFDIDPKILVAQTVNFFLLLWLLNQFMFTPLRKIVADRQDQIAADLRTAEQEKQKAEAVRSEWEKKIETVEQEAYRLRQQAVIEANSARDQILAEAKASAAAQKQAADKDILLEKQKAWIELREDVVQLSLAVAEKVIEKSLDDKTHHELIRNAIAQLEKTK